MLDSVSLTYVLFRMLHQPLLALLLLSVALVHHPTEGETFGSWLCLASKMLGALLESNTDRHCSLQRFTQAYKLMTTLRCSRCDKFFHCTANYNAVYGCQTSQANRDAAETIRCVGGLVCLWCDRLSDRYFMVVPLSYFSFMPVLHDWCNKGRGMCYTVCWMVNIK